MQLAYNDSSNKEMAIEPLAGKIALSRRTIPEQIRVLERWGKGMRWAALGCGILGGAMIGIYLARRGLKALRKRRMRYGTRALQTLLSNSDIQPTRRLSSTVTVREAALNLVISAASCEPSHALPCQAR